MKFEENNIRYINLAIGRLNSLVDEVYESLVDFDFEKTNTSLSQIIEEVQDLRKSISNEI